MSEPKRPFLPRQVVQRDDLNVAENIIDAKLAALHMRMDERDRLYSERAESQREAILKAEKAQSEYNVRSNEFRGQLDDQAKTLMPRSEASALITNLNEKIKRIDEDIRTLREWRSQDEGGGQGGKAMIDASRSNIALAISGIVLLILLWRAFSGN